MHLAVLAGDGTIGLDDDGSVVVDARGAALKKREHQHHAQFLGQGAEGLGGRTGDGLCQVTQTGVFLLAEIKGIVQFLKDHELGALGGGFPDIALQALYIGGDVGCAVLLHHAYFQFSHLPVSAELM